MLTVGPVVDVTRLSPTASAIPVELFPSFTRKVRSVEDHASLTPVSWVNPASTRLSDWARVAVAPEVAPSPATISWRTTSRGLLVTIPEYSERAMVPSVPVPNVTLAVCAPATALAVYRRYTTSLEPDTVVSVALTRTPDPPVVHVAPVTIWFQREMLRTSSEPVATGDG